MTEILRTKVKDLLCSEAGHEVLAKGWVRTKRGNKEIAFIASNVYNKGNTKFFNIFECLKISLS